MPAGNKSGTSGVQVTYSGAASSADGPFFVTYQRRMDSSPNSGELYGVYNTKQEADKAVADIQKWAARMKADNAYWGVTKSDWDVVGVNVSGSRSPPAGGSSPSVAAAERVWGRNADRAAKNLAKDKDLADALREAAGRSKVFTEANLRAIVTIESGADRTTGRNSYGYAGLFQMGASAAKEAGYKYSSISEPSQWRRNIAAGVRYLEINAERLRRAGVEVTPLNVYLAHQQGAGGARKLLRAVQDGSAATTPATRNELANLPASFVKGITGSGRQVTVQNYYDYWSASFRTVDQRVNQATPSPTPTPVPFRWLD
jgi:hypothetical protein